MGFADVLQFDEALHTYTLGNRRLPSVTQVLQPLADFSMVPKAVLDAKRDLGQRVHLACQLDDEDDLDEASVEVDVRPYLSAWRRFLVESGAEVLNNEQRVCDPNVGYAGTLDNVLLMQGAKWVVDKKTCIAVPLAVGPQTAAYMQALHDPSVTRRAAVRLRPDGSYRFDQLTAPDDWSAFLACLCLQRFKEKNQ
jgi:hypothetical protein